jgi:hypothetical protein
LLPWLLFHELTYVSLMFPIAFNVSKSRHEINRV